MIWQLKYDLHKNWMLHAVLVFVALLFAVIVFPDAWATHPAVFVFSVLELAAFWFVLNLLWRIEGIPVDRSYRWYVKGTILLFLATITTGGICIAVLNLPIHTWTNAALVLLGLAITVVFASLTLKATAFRL